MLRSFLPSAVALTFLAVRTGCWQSKYVYYEEIIAKEPTAWNHSDARTVILANMEMNRSVDDAPFRIIATRFNPSVLAAVSRLQQEKEDWSRREMFENLDQDARRYTGLTVDPHTGEFVDAFGKSYFSERQLDSLAFLIGVYDLNTGGGVSQPFLEHALFDLKNYVFNHPDVETFIDRIVLENEQGQWLKPNWLAGMANGELVEGKNLLVMFQLKQDGGRFLANSSTMTIVVRGFSRDIRLPFLIRR